MESGLNSLNSLNMKTYKMNRICYILCFVTLILSLINMSCKKVIEGADTTLPTPPLLPPPPPPSNQNILAQARMNMTIELPMNFAILNGETTGPGRNGAKVKWEKISGPASYLLVHPDSLITKVTNLEKGAYTFKLTATSNTAQISTDTMTLIVQDPTSLNKQIFFWSLNWSCPFGCGIYLGYPLSLLPPNSPFTLYLRREFSSVWELIVPESSSLTARFVYSVSGDQIMVFDTSYIESSDHPEIKIVF